MIWALKQEKVLNINFGRGSAMDKFSNFNPKVCFLFFVFAVLLILLIRYFLSYRFWQVLFIMPCFRAKRRLKRFLHFFCRLQFLSGFLIWLLRLTELMFSFQFQIRILLPRGLLTACAKELCFQA